MKAIGRYKEFISKVNESFNSPKEIKWDIQDNKIFGFFNVDNIRYRIESIHRSEDIYSYSFSYYKNDMWIYDLGNKDVNVFNVFSTILYSIDYLYSKYNPKAIIFIASDISDKRKRLYTNFCEKFTNDNNLEYISNQVFNYRVYIIHEKNLSEEYRERIFDEAENITIEMKQ